LMLIPAGLWGLSIRRSNDRVSNTRFSNDPIVR
jgi:hypothetical protein